MTKLKNLITGKTSEHNSVRAAKNTARNHRRGNAAFTKWEITQGTIRLRSFPSAKQRSDHSEAPRLEWRHE